MQRNADRFHRAGHHLTAADLDNYSHGMLPKEEVRRVERHLMDCELCSDALAGIRGQSDAYLLMRVRRELRTRHERRAGLRRGIFSSPLKLALLATVVILALVLIIILFLANNSFLFPSKI